MAAVAVEQLVEQSTRHQVYIERLKSGEVKQFAAFLREMDQTLRRRLVENELTDFSRTRVEALLREVDGQLAEIMARYRATLKTNLDELAIYEAGFEARNINTVLNGVETVVPASGQVVAAVTAAPLSVRGPDGGKLLDAFVGDWSKVERGRVIGAVRQGFFEGRTSAQVIRTIRGTKARGFRDGLLATTDRNADAVVRTAVQHVASVARQQTWEANPDIVKGVRWSSTLDARTTQICRSLDGTIFPLNEGPRPPIHVRCRSSTAAALDDKFSFLREDATRFSRGPDGVNWIDADETYYSWLKRQTTAFQNDAIGPVRGKLLRDGGLTAERFAELNLGKNFEPLTLDQMRRIEPTAFEKAKL